MVYICKSIIDKKALSTSAFRVKNTGITPPAVQGLRQPEGREKRCRTLYFLFFEGSAYPVRDFPEEADFFPYAF